MSVNGRYIRFKFQSDSINTGLGGWSSAGLWLPLNSNLILLIPFKSWSGMDELITFKFQSDSINTNYF